MTRAIVLAAGEGTRLRPHTADRPKCLVPLAGRALLEWQLGALRAAGVERVTVITGYRSEQVAALGVDTIHNDRFDRTNMVASLMCARALMDGAEDLVVCYGDLVYEPRVVAALVASPAPVAITIDREWQRLWELRMTDPLTDAETLRIGTDGNVSELGRKATSYTEIEGQYMGLIQVRATMAPTLVQIYDRLDPSGPYDGRDRDNMFMTSFLQHLIDRGTPVAAVSVDGGWLEVDTLGDLDTYERLAAAGELDRFCVLDHG
jgi:L-glutamine-phosphate cytidylyltransferase